MRMDRCISPRPSTRKLSVESVSFTCSETSFSSSRYSRSRIWREVTYFPSLPAKGESLTEKVISMVGSLILTKGMETGAAGSHRVLPMVMLSMPEKATISPTQALSTGVFFSPSYWYRAVILPLVLRSGLW